MMIRETGAADKVRTIDRASAMRACNPLLSTTSLTPWRAVAAALIIGWGMVPSDAQALPEGGEVKAGDAAIVRSAPKRLDVIQNSDKAVIDWRGFSIGGDEHTNFQQPSSSSMTLNRVTGGDPSEILGRLSANGQILLINPNGILFGAGARVDVSGLVATTADIRNEDFLAGRLVFWTPGNGNASVVNRGQITVQEGGLVALVAPGVSNQGIIQARLGRVALAAGNTFTVDLYGDQLIQLAVDGAVLERALSPDGEPLDSLVSNSGRITADGGTVLMTAGAAKGVVNNVINMDGIVEARAVEEKGGVIALLGGDAGTVRVAGTLDASGHADGKAGGRIAVTGEQVALATGARLDASGDSGGGTVHVGGGWQGGGVLPRAQTMTVSQGAVVNADAMRGGDGGEVVVWADGRTAFAGGVSARGGSEGGDGGRVEVSGKQQLAFAGTVDTRAPQGKTGSLLLDPVDLTIGTGAGDTISAATVVANMNTTGMTLSADNSITVNEAVDTSAQSNSNTLHFNDADGGGLTANLNATITLGSNQQLTGEVTTANVTDGASIQNGIDVAIDGATVNVAAGTYAEDVTISKSMTLTGAGAGSTTIQGQAGGQTAAVRIAADNVTLGGAGADEGLRIEGAGVRAVHLAEGVSGATIQNNTIVAAENRIGLDTAGAQSNHTIQGNTFTAAGIGTNKQLAYINGTASLGAGRASSNVNILDNTFQGPAQLALGQEAANSRIEGNTFTGANSYAALELWAAPQSLTGNSFEGDNAMRVRMSANAKTGAIDYGTPADVVAANDFATAVTNRSDSGEVAAGESAVVYGRIQTAVDDAAANDILDVGAGTYNISQRIDVAKALTLNGAQAGVDARSTGSRTPGGSGESIIDGGGSVGTLLRITGNNVTVDGFEFRNGMGDLITSSSSSTIANPVIRNNIVHGSSSDEGMQIRNSQNAVIEYNRVYDTAGDGINLAGDDVGGMVSSTGGIIRFNEVYDIDSPDGAIYVYGSSGTTIQGNWVYNVNNNDGIKLGDKTGADTTKTGGSILNNVVENSIQDGITVYSSNTVVSGNTVRDSRSENGAIFVDFNVDNVQIANNTISNSGVTSDANVTYGIRVGKDQNPTNVSVTGNIFTDNEAQLFHKNGSGEIVSILSGNTFDRSVTINGGNIVWSAIQDGINAASANGTVNVGAGSYDGGVNVNKQGLSVLGANGAIVNVDAGSGTSLANTGFTIDDNNVTVDGFDIRGPYAGQNYQDIVWGSDNSFGVNVKSGRTGFTVANNDIADIRTGINVETSVSTGTIRNNMIDNTKGGVLLRSADTGMTITSNARGSIGNEWGLVLNLHQVSSSPGTMASTARQSQILAYSTANNGMTVLDRAYENSNRSHVSVDATSTATAADDFGFGNALGNSNQPLSSLNAALTGVVTGGSMSVAAGNYAEVFTVNKNVDMTVGSGTAQVTALTTNTGTTLGLSGTVRSTGAMTFNGNLALRDNVTLNTSPSNANMTFNGTINGVTANGQNLTLNAGTGSIVAKNIGQTVALRDMTVTTGSYNASSGSTNLRSLTVNGTDIDVGDSTVNATQNVNLQGTNISGSINAQNVTVQGGGNVTTKVTATNQANVSGTNVSGSVSAPTVTVAATQTANTTVTATNTASVSGANVSGSVSAPTVTVAATQNANANVTATTQASISGQNVSGSVTAPKASVVASNNVQITANVNELTAQAKSGNVSGNVGSYTVGGSGGVLKIGGQSAAPLPSGVGRDRSYLDPAASGAETGANASSGLASEAFGGGKGQNIFGSSFSLGLAPGEIEPAAGEDGTEATENARPADFLNDFWGYYFSSQAPAEGTEGSDAEGE